MSQSQFDDAMGSMFYQAFEILGSVPCVYAGTSYTGVFDTFAEELELVIGGKVVRARGQIVIPITQFAAGAEKPTSQKTIIVAGHEWRVLKTEEDILALTCYLGGKDE